MDCRNPAWSSSLNEALPCVSWLSQQSRARTGIPGALYPLSQVHGRACSINCLTSGMTYWQCLLLFRRNSFIPLKSFRGKNAHKSLASLGNMAHALPSEELHGDLGGSMARMADSNWPKGYSRPQDIMPSTQTEGSWPGVAECCWEMGWASDIKQ